jgi:SAM-dependent methyltransferase
VPPAASKPYDLSATTRYFDRFGGLLQLPNWLDRAVYREFIAAADLRNARHVFELGPGLGMLARSILGCPSKVESWVLAEASSVLCRRLASSLCRHDARGQLFWVNQPPPFPFAASGFDRFISCFVLDCMDRDTQRQYLREARRLLKPGGTFCAMSVTRGTTFASSLVMGLGNVMARVSPGLALGALFVELEPSFSPDDWDLVVNRVVTSMGFATRIIVAQAREAPLCE